MTKQFVGKLKTQKRVGAQDRARAMSLNSSQTASRNMGSGQVGDIELVTERNSGQETSAGEFWLLFP